MADSDAVISRYNQLHRAHRLMINSWSYFLNKGWSWISFLNVSHAAICVLPCVSWDTKANLVGIASFGLMSRVTLCPLSCDVEETAKAGLKEGFVLDLALSVIKITNLMSYRVRGHGGVPLHCRCSMFQTSIETSCTLRLESRVVMFTPETHHSLHEWIFQIFMSIATFLIHQ